ncbi:transposase [Methylosarcina fibrata]|uniref:transposase n=1 Tax=Methylosarcina fibrata TaxID=105972 RepID=UPI0012FC30C7
MSTKPALRRNRPIVRRGPQAAKPRLSRRNEGRRLNVIGALRSSGQLVLTKLWQSIHGLWFFAFLMAMRQQVRKPMMVILDNASIYTAQKLKPYWDLLEKKDMRFYCLPVQSRTESD